MTTTALRPELLGISAMSERSGVPATALRRTGMPVSVVRRYVELCRQGPGNEAERLALLEQHREDVRARVHQAQRDLADIAAKIATYQQEVLS